MNQQTFLQRLETFGYYMLPRPHAESPGYSGLLAVLRQMPQGHEPEKIQLRLHEWNGKTTVVNLHADVDPTLSHVVCPGRMVIRSRREQEATFFTFGGTLESEALSGEAVYSLRSAAPVLELLPQSETVTNLLAEETEALFARTEAHERLNSQQLLHRLVKAGSEAVYLAVLQSLLPEGEDIGAPYPLYGELTDMLVQERKWLRKTERWPLIPRDLATLVYQVGDQ